MKPARAAWRNSPPLPAAKQNAQPISDPPAGTRLKTPPDTNKNDRVFFFKANEKNGAFCQWYPATFTVTKQEMSDLVGHEIDPGDPWTPIYFNCAEQFMMYCKAGRFHDKTAQQLILATKDPKEQKRIARETKGFDAQSWDKIKSQVVLAGNIAKFGQNPTLRTPASQDRRYPARRGGVRGPGMGHWIYCTRGHDTTEQGEMGRE